VARSSNRVSVRIAARRWRSEVRHAADELRQWAAGAARGPEAVLLILGCQRSGTTLMTHIFERDPDAKVYPEHSSLSAGDRAHGLRLEAPERVARKLSRSRFPLLVMKPLVESQNAASFLEAIPGARGLWMFRSWNDVARSNLARFGEDNGIRNLRGIVERRPDDWRSEAVSEESRRIVGTHFHEEMNPWDAAALFWWARNALYFEHGLDADPRVRTCSYEELVADPRRVVQGVYDVLERSLPGEMQFEGVSAASVGRGREIFFSAEVAALCDTMFERLQKSHAKEAACA
jgi:hypothetical protein